MILSLGHVRILRSIAGGPEEQEDKTPIVKRHANEITMVVITSDLEGISLVPLDNLDLLKIAFGEFLDGAF